MTRFFNVYNAATGKALLTACCEEEFDRWYDHHCFWRQPRSAEEVHPQLRDIWAKNEHGDYWLVED